MKLAAHGLVVALLLTGCATTPTFPPVNMPDETEFQKQLDHDPRFQKLMDQLAVPVGDSWHFHPTVARQQAANKTVYYFGATADKAW